MPGYDPVQTNDFYSRDIAATICLSPLFLTEETVSGYVARLRRA